MHASSWALTNPGPAYPHEFVKVGARSNALPVFILLIILYSVYAILTNRQPADFRLGLASSPVTYEARIIQDRRLFVLCADIVTSSLYMFVKVDNQVYGFKRQLKSSQKSCEAPGLGYIWLCSSTDQQCCGVQIDKRQRSMLPTKYVCQC